MIEFRQNRFLSKVTIVAVAAQILSMLVVLGVIDVAKSDAINGVIVAVCECLTIFGVLNNPTDKANF